MKKIEVSAAIITQNSKILITQRLGGEFHGLWEFPGGKIEPGESKEETVIREIREELNLEITPLSHFLTIEYTYASFHLTMHTYLCRIESGTMELRDHSESRWVTQSELKTVEWVPADIEIVDKLIVTKTL